MAERIQELSRKLEEIEHFATIVQGPIPFSKFYMWERERDLGLPKQRKSTPLEHKVMEWPLHERRT